MSADAAERAQLASALETGEGLELFRADGPLVAGLVVRVDGTDVVLRVESDSVAAGELLTARLYHGEAAWFATFIAQGAEPLSPGGWELALRIGDVLQVTSERWAERIGVECLCVVRAERGGGRPARGVCTDLSLTGVAVLLQDALPEIDAQPGGRVGVTLAGDGVGTIAFRGRVARAAQTGAGLLVGVEVIGISRDDHRRLQRLLSRHDRAGSDPTGGGPT